MIILGIVIFPKTNFTPRGLIHLHILGLKIKKFYRRVQIKNMFKNAVEQFRMPTIRREQEGTMIE